MHKHMSHIVHAKLVEQKMNTARNEKGDTSGKCMQVLN